MQRTRQRIIEYLREHGPATVDELSQALDSLTAVTVRHHLDVLRGEGLVSPPQVRHRTTPGRPKYLYGLTDKAESLFPGNLPTLASTMLDELKHTLNPEQISAIFEGVAERMAAGLPPGPDGEAFEQRLDRVVDHLVQHGYEARWERSRQGYLLHTANCPYSGVIDEHTELCMLDIRYISHLLGRVPQRVAHMAEGDAMCSYLVTADRVKPG
jgi:predicted ArsR family transcriptional regulator